MSVGTFFGVGNVAKKAKKMYVGIGGVAKTVKKAYLGVNGVAKLVYSSAGEAFNSLFIVKGTTSSTYLTTLRTDMSGHLTDNGYIWENVTLSNVNFQGADFYGNATFNFNGYIDFNDVDLSGWSNNQLVINHVTKSGSGFSVGLYDSNGDLIVEKQTAVSGTENFLSVTFTEAQKLSARKIRVTFNYRNSTSNTAVAVLAISNISP